MHRRGMRFALVLLLFATAAGAATFAWTVDQRLRAVSASTRAASSHFDTLVQAIAQFDAAQQTFDPARDSEATWFGRVQALLTQIQAEGAWLPRVASADAGAAAGTFLTVTGRVASAIARAEENLRAGRDLMAADLVQDEGRPGADAMRAAVLEWRSAELTASDNQSHALLQQLWTVLGGVAAVWALGVLLLARRRAPAVDVTPASMSILEENPADLIRPAAPAVVPAPALDLTSAAALCTAIGTASDPTEFPGLLARTAQVLGASGVVIWLKDDGDALIPGLVHGYDARVLARMGALPLDADNATTAAWHLGHLEIVGGDERSPGALAVPMFQGARRTGVFTAEFRDQREADAAVRALTSMLAAQFASVVAPRETPEAPVVEAPDQAAVSLEATGS